MTASEHARKVRNAKRTGIFLTLLAFAVATPVALNLAGSNPDTPGFLDPSDSPTPSSSPSGSPTDEPTTPPSETSEYRIDAELNAVFAVPDGWRAGEFEGHRTVHPEELAAPPQDGPTVYVSMTYGDIAPKEGREPTTFAGLPAEETVDGERHWTVVKSWPMSPYATFDGPIELTIWSEASNDALASEYQDGTVEVYDSIRPLWNANGTIANVERSGWNTRLGSAAESVSLDGASAAVAGFMDARARIEDYGTFVTREAMDQYKALKMPDGSSRRDFPENYRIDDYTIASVDAADANSYEIVVEIVFIDLDERETTITERLFVGPGAATDGENRPFVIRGVVDEA